jgi:GTPase SAR1 family protein
MILCFGSVVLDDIELEVKKLRILTANNVLNTYPYLSGKLRGVYKICVTGCSGSGKTTMIKCFDPKAHGREVPRYFYVDYEFLKENPDLFPESNTATQTFDFTVVALIIGKDKKQTEIIKFSDLSEEMIDEKDIKWVTIFYLFGTPGQWRFKDIRAFAERRSDGVIFLIDPLDSKLKENFKQFREQVIKNVERKVPIVYAVNKQDLPNVMTGKEVKKDISLKSEKVYNISGLKCQNINRPIIALIRKIQKEELGDNED